MYYCNFFSQNIHTVYNLLFHIIFILTKIQFSHNHWRWDLYNFQQLPNSKKIFIYYYIYYLLLLYMLNSYNDTLSIFYYYYQNINLFHIKSIHIIQQKTKINYQHNQLLQFQHNPLFQAILKNNYKCYNNNLLLYIENNFNGNLYIFLNIYYNNTQHHMQLGLCNIH